MGICKHLIRFTNFYGSLSMTGRCELDDKPCDRCGPCRHYIRQEGTK